MTIIGTRVILREISLADTEDIIRWRNKRFVQERFIFQEKFTREIHEKWMKEMVNTGLVKQFIIIEKQNLRPVGTAYLRDIDKKNQKAEYGMFIGEEDAQGQGYGTESAKLLVDFAFSQLKLHKIFLRVFADNVSSIHSCINAGFIQEAVLKDDIRVDEVFKNLIIMSIFKENNNLL